MPPCRRRWSARSGRAISDARHSCRRRPGAAGERCAAARPRSELRFLTCGSVDDGKSTLIGRLINDATGLFEDQIAALKDDSPPLRHASTATSTSPCCSTASRPSASRASPSTSPTASSRPPSAPSWWPTRRAISNTPATWRPAHPMPSSPCCWSTPARAFSSRRVAMPRSCRCSASATSCWRSTRSTWSTSPRRASARSRRRSRRSPQSLGFHSIVSIPLSARARRQCRAAERAHALVRRPAAAALISRRSIPVRGAPTRRCASRCNGSTGPTMRFPRLCRHPGLGPRRRRRSRRGRAARASARRSARIVSFDGDLRRARRPAARSP